jgi:hypothetical protein
MRISFGLSDEYIENVYEQFFFLKYSGGWSFSEAYNLPVGLRKWFVERLLRQLEAEKEAIEKGSKSGNGAQTLTPQNQPAPPKGMF